MIDERSRQMEAIWAVIPARVYVRITNNISLHTFHNNVSISVLKLIFIFKRKIKQSIIPQIQQEDGTLTTTAAEKRQEIRKALLPDINHEPTKIIEPEDDSQWPLLAIEDVDYALKNTPSNKASGEDGITGKVLKMAWKNRLFKKDFSRYYSLA